MGEVEHKILEYADHLGVYIVGVFAVAGAVAAYLWRDRNADKVRIVNNEKQYEQLSWMVENILVTKDELAECGAEKDKQHYGGIKEVITKLDGVISSNAEEHNDIVEKMNDQHIKTLNKMMSLHGK